MVSQRRFIAGARSLNEQDLHENLSYFKVPQTDIESIRSKLVFKMFDEYANILKGMYSTRFNGVQLDILITLGAQRRRRRRGLDSL